MMPFTTHFEHLKIQLEAIKSATNNFADENCIGRGGFGKVYKGELVHAQGKTVVAVKQLDRRFGQGNPEFWKEIMMLSIYKHENIVSLLGFCDESDQKILVYEYASRRSLDLYLKSDDLTWIRRLNICIGAARGLAYLHNPGWTQQRVLHRDIKSFNILLDENWNARISDLGLSKYGPANQQYTFLVSDVVGTIGYCDPVYVETGVLTKESDVYSFGVVLFEVLCGRLSFDNNNDKHQRLTGLARQCYEQNKINDIVYGDLKNQINPKSLKAFTTIAYQCLKRKIQKRPLMTEVVRMLQSALEYQVQMLPFDSVEDAQRINSAVESEEKFRKIAAQEKEKYLEAAEEVEMASNLLAKEAYEKEIAEGKAPKESSVKQHFVDDALITNDKRYRRYTVEEIEVATDSFSKTKVIGEGAYGKVYRCHPGYTWIAIKVLWSDTSQKKLEFLREVEVLSKLSHPHIVQLLGACPERGCLIYEYMENGSLDDFFSQKTSKYYLPWFSRFRIAYEGVCALAFLHNSKPEPIVHRHLKPGNILLDGNFVSKIGDVGMAKLITDVVPDDVTKYKDSVLDGTMYYIDPEYHGTGTIEPKSDLYAFGIIVLQLLTLLQPKGIIAKVESAVSCGTLSDILDESITDWPLAEAEELAQVGLKCCSLRCRDRPDPDTEVLPVLKKLYEFGDNSRKVFEMSNDPPTHFICPILQEIMDDPHIAADGYTYEHKAIEMWVERHDVSPITNRKLQHKMLTPNYTLQSPIHNWRQSRLYR